MNCDKALSPWKPQLAHDQSQVNLCADLNLIHSIERGLVCLPWDSQWIPQCGSKAKYINYHAYLSHTHLRSHLLLSFPSIQVYQYVAARQANWACWASWASWASRGQRQSWPPLSSFTGHWKSRWFPPTSGSMWLQGSKAKSLCHLVPNLLVPFARFVLIYRRSTVWGFWHSMPTNWSIMANRAQME